MSRSLVQLAHTVYMQQLNDHVLEAIDLAEAQEHQARLNGLRTALGVTMYSGAWDDLFRANSEVRRLLETFEPVMPLEEALELARALVRLKPASLHLGFVLRGYATVH